MKQTEPKTPKPTTGKLLLIKPGNKPEQLAWNQPFAVLQNLKKEYLQRGYKPEQLKITY